MIIRRATAADREVLLDCWLRSVRATHTFVSPQDIEEMTPQVRAYLSSDAESKIDSMFLAREFIGRGVGRQLVWHAQSHWADLKVDVNEQNEAATGFYEACGFIVTGRSELDEQGRPYPLLHMKLIAPTLVRPPERRP